MKVFDDLLKQFDEYTSRRVGVMEENAAKLEKLHAEAGKLQRELSGNILIMESEPYRKKAQRLDDVLEEIMFLDEKAAKIQAARIVSQEEQDAFFSAIHQEQKALREQAEAELYPLAAALIPVVEKYTTELNKLQTLSYAFSRSCAVNYYESTETELPPMLSLANRLLFDGFNPYDKAVDNGANVTACADVAEWKTAVSAVLDAESKIDGITTAIGLKTI